MLSALLSSLRAEQKPPENEAIFGWEETSEVLVKTKEALDRSKQSFGFMEAGLGSAFRSSGKVSLALGDGQTDRLGQTGIGVEEVLHCGVANLKDFGLFHCHHIRRARLTGKEGHLAEETSFREFGDFSRTCAIRNLNRNFAAVDDEH
jgi:hypothetical protein